MGSHTCTHTHAALGHRLPATGNSLQLSEGPCPAGPGEMPPGKRWSARHAHSLQKPSAPWIAVRYPGAGLPWQGQGQGQVSGAKGEEYFTGTQV